jgi:lipopolysaccharide O-acetyltransferase
MKYSISELFKFFIFFIYTRIVIPNARLIRYPIDIRGKRNIDFGNNFTAGHSCRLEAYSSRQKKILKIGKNVQINDFIHITATESVIIGDNVLIASKVYISDTSHGSYKGDDSDSDPSIAPQKRSLVSLPVFIGENVWIGESVSILPGVKIGRASIIGANSVVTKDIPDYCIAVGNPAKVIKKYNFDTNHWER